MIHQSQYWKEPLIEMARRLAKFSANQDPHEQQLAQVERDVFIGFYSVRKLLEAQDKITDKTRARRIILRWYRNQEAVTRHNRHRLEALYDFSKPQEEARDLFFVCHRIIHSYIFSPYFDGKGFAGILFSSDIDKDKKLYLLTVNELITIFELVGNDYPHQIKWERDEDGNESLAVD